MAAEVTPVRRPVAHLVYRLGTRPLDFAIFIEDGSEDPSRRTYARAMGVAILARMSAGRSNQVEVVYEAARRQLEADGCIVAPPDVLQ